LKGFGARGSKHYAGKSFVESDLNILDGIYYIVLADLVGSTKFGAKWGNDALTARIHTFVGAAKKALENARMSSNTGRFLKSVGDGVLIAFNHFPDVVQWQMEFDGELSLAESGQEQFQTRTCVHAGELRFDEGDTLNLATNQVSKMEKSVGAGEMVLSDIAHQLAVPSLYPRQCEFKEHGTVRIDGYSRPVKLHRLVVKADIAFLVDKTGRGRK
jgi:class 3 adenylate cyclase